MDCSFGVAISMNVNTVYIDCLTKKIEVPLMMDTDNVKPYMYKCVHYVCIKWMVCCKSFLTNQEATLPIQLKGNSTVFSNIQ